MRKNFKIILLIILVLVGIGTIISIKIYKDKTKFNEYINKANKLLSYESYDEARAMILKAKDIEDSKEIEEKLSYIDKKENDIKNDKHNFIKEEAFDLLSQYIRRSFPLKKGEGFYYDYMDPKDSAFDSEKIYVDGEVPYEFSVSKIMPSRKEKYSLGNYYVTSSGIYFRNGNIEKLAQINENTIKNVDVERDDKYSDDWGRDTIEYFGEDGRFGIFDIDLEKGYGLCDEKYFNVIDYVSKYKEIKPYIYAIGSEYGYTKLNYETGDFKQSKKLEDFSKEDIKIFKALKEKDK